MRGSCALRLYGQELNAESYAICKLPQMRIHDLRHTCATLLLAQGVHAKVVQEILGHSQITLTLDNYTSVLPSISREAAEQMDAVLSA